MSAMSEALDRSDRPGPGSAVVTNMANSTLEKPIEATSDEPVIPNFREDERIQQRYASMIERRIKTFYMEHENSIRRNASNKRDDLREELDRAQEEYQRWEEAAETTREAYRAAFPHHVKKLRLDEPSVLENMKSLGAAKKLYWAADDARRALEHAASNVRRIEHNEEQLEIELQKALERHPEVAKDVTESERWLDEIHAEEELGAMKASVDAILLERQTFAERLASGKVGPDELRLRSFAEQGIKHVLMPLNGILFERLATFGDATYAIVCDTRKQRYALPYDPRLNPLFGTLVDIVKSGTEFAVTRTTRPNSPIPMSLLDFFMTLHDKNEAAAQAAWHAHTEFVKAPRPAVATPADELEAKVIELLAAYAKEHAA
jgi:hypothetical protein